MIKLLNFQYHKAIILPHLGVKEEEGEEEDIVTSKRLEIITLSDNSLKFPNT